MATERACLVIADISGYTSYLAGVELDHAQDIIADLINTVVKGLRPFKLAKLEGDAAFVHALAATIDGSILLDTIERCYFAFRKRAFDIRQASICQCNACVLIPSLNLKIVAHHGTVGVQKMAGRSELVGQDVIIVHRLLKNAISEPAYALLTDACIAETSLDPLALGMRRHVETYEHVGEIGGWLEDLEHAYATYQESQRHYITAEEAALDFDAFYPAPPELVWEYVSSPSLRPQWSHGMNRIDQLDVSGRRRAGTVNHCVHGDQVFVQEFLDWRPPRYYTAKTTIAPGVSFLTTHEVVPVEGGAVVHDRFLRPRDKAARELFDQMLDYFRQGHEGETAQLARLLDESVRAADPAVEPDLPAADEAHRLATSVPA